MNAFGLKPAHAVPNWQAPASIEKPAGHRGAARWRVRSELECPPPRGRPLLLSGWPDFFGAGGCLPIWYSVGGFATNSSLPGFAMIGGRRGERRVHKCHLHYAHARSLVIGQSQQHKLDRAALSSREGKTDFAQKRNAQPVQIRARPPRRGSSRAGLRGGQPISI